MFKIYKTTKIYILCPGETVTGGPETLHQLCNKLRKFGHDAYMVYIPNYNDPIPDVYRRYNVECAKTVEDLKENIVIVPEVFPWRLEKYSSIQKGIFWLSVKNSPRRKNRIQASYKFQKLNGIIKEKFSFDIDRLLFGAPKAFFAFTEDKNKSITHLCQSKYCETFLDKNKAQYFRLSGFINKDFLKEAPEIVMREDIILYNPLKGKKFVRKLLNLCPSLKWVPICDMTSSQISTLMQKSKVYIDFGPFPGRDRIPREAAVSCCCLITGKRGAARYFQDVTIPVEYKFCTNHFNPRKVLKKIKECLREYEIKVDDFKTYRRIVQAEEEQLELQVKQIFEVKQDCKNKEILC